MTAPPSRFPAETSQRGVRPNRALIGPSFCPYLGVRRACFGHLARCLAPGKTFAQPWAGARPASAELHRRRLKATSAVHRTPSRLRGAGST